MFNSRYSEMEMQQWHDASGRANDATRHNGAHALVAKGQSEEKQSKHATTATQSQQPKHDDWAGECLFDCYNS